MNYINKVIMKKLYILIAVSCIGLYAQAKPLEKQAKDTLQTNNTQNKEALKLNVKLAKLQVDLATVQNRIPDDEEKVKNTAEDSRDALKKSNEKAAAAVGGDAGDAKTSEK